MLTEPQISSTNVAACLTSSASLLSGSLLNAAAVAAGSIALYRAFPASRASNTTGTCAETRYASVSRDTPNRAAITMSRTNPRPRERKRPRPTAAERVVRLPSGLVGWAEGVVSGAGASWITSARDAMFLSSPALPDQVMGPGQEKEGGAGGLQVAHGDNEHSTNRERCQAGRYGLGLPPEGRRR